MHNNDFQLYLYAWARFHDLKESKRSCCGHGVATRQGTFKDTHERWCVSWRTDLIDHASMWTLKGNRLLIAFTFRPRPDDLGYPSYLVRVNAYAERLGITSYIPDVVEPIHALYASDTTAVLYGTSGLDLAPFATLPLGLSPDLDRRTARLARSRAAKAKARSHKPLPQPRPPSPTALFRAKHGDEVRALYASGDFIYRDLAERFGVSIYSIEIAVRAQQ